jgi:hypothetical protein
VSQSSTNSTVTCTTDNGSGFGYALTVFVGSGLAAQSTIGYDLYSYAIPPVVTGVSGCAVDLPGRIAGNNITTQCPTTGSWPNGQRVIITIFGAYFVGSISSVVINDAQCEGPTPVPGKLDTALTCSLPAGTGLAPSVVINRGAAFSEPVDFISYAPPTLLSVEGCVDQGITTTECSRDGDGIITINGYNFGFKGANVLVGPRGCKNPTHTLGMEHSQVSCTLDPGAGSDNSVILFQQHGEPSNNPEVTVDYAPCPAGTMAEGVECSPCHPGTISATPGLTVCTECPAGTISVEYGQSVCTECPIGYYSTDGAQSCLPCSIGYEAARPGSGSCTTCVSGYFGASQSASILPSQIGSNATVVPTTINVCKPCQVGSQQAFEGRTTCDSCSTGRFNPAEGRSACELCSAGQFTQLLGRTECVPCFLGKIQAVPGQSSCDDCQPGYFANSRGQDSCLPCDRGTYQAQSSQSICTACEIGRFAQAEGSDQCIPCQNGTVAHQPNALACDSCPSGTYAFSTSQCTSCPSGRARVMADLLETVGGPDIISFDAFDGWGLDLDPDYDINSQPRATYAATSCTVCKAGFYQDLFGSSFCYHCSAGSYSSSKESASCTPCEVGRFSGEGTATVCQNCTFGRYSDKLNQTTCIDCEIGRYQELTGSTACVLCPVVHPTRFALKLYTCLVLMMRLSLCSSRLAKRVQLVKVSVLTAYLVLLLFPIVAVVHYVLLVIMPISTPF